MERVDGNDRGGHSSKSAEAASRDERTLFIARVFLGVCLSVLLHVIVSIATYELTGYFEPTAKPRTTAFIEWIEPTDIKKQDWSKLDNQIVRKTDVPKESLDLSVKPVRRFLSEDKQTVKKETRAAASGMTENRSDTSLSESRPEARPERRVEAQTASRSRPQSRERTEEVLPNSIFKEGLGDISAEFKKRTIAATEKPASRTSELTLPSDPRRNRGVSTTGEVLPPDVQIGDFTALNTDRFVYYTYYARIEEQIRHRWVRYVKAAMYGGGDVPEGARELVTNLEIVLDREGDFVRAILHEGSGSKDIDAAPMLAFREAKRIPHPPREMVKEDGTIRLFYAFHVDQLPAVAKTKIPTRAAGSADAADAKTE